MFSLVGFQQEQELANVLQRHGDAKVNGAEMCWL